METSSRSHVPTDSVLREYIFTVAVLSRASCGRNAIIDMGLASSDHTGPSRGDMNAISTRFALSP
jgi:hypothetical protein